MENFATKVIGFQPLTIIAKLSILDVCSCLDYTSVLKIFVFFSFLEISLTISRDKSAELKKLQDIYVSSPSSVDSINIYGIEHLFSDKTGCVLTKRSFPYLEVLSR